ncbi:hypothetical protein LU293_05005 [Moraxella nasovis]|uniref:hypothetical protein n=1 Tax=Moraxella nasovis TaxID=2904121 RepID=UPI001F61E0AD|nr:hypothetical protein [Moraxella nasovis]UNU74250.1 hypothetical protein LU293_05005 [Moraxella nasovis]
MSKNYTLKTRNVSFNQTNLVKHFQSIRDNAEQNLGGIVTNADDILDLKDFLSCFYSGRDELKQHFDLDNCEFYVDYPPKEIRNRNSKKMFLY